ncbi:hypothetical protein KA478_00880 [Patescibacteria group bacterium]|nr:hypothetical protein [Patescibacteria group bacterium]
MNTARGNNNHEEKAIVYPFFDNESNQIRQKVIKAPEELIDNFENIPNADEIREKFERIKSCVKKFTLLLDKDDLDEAQKNRMAYLTKNLQTYFREYDILTTNSPEDKAFKQLLYGTEKYKFL